MSTSTEPVVPDFDGAWKTALHTWLPEAMALFWPMIHDAINWQHAPVYLDKEIRRLGRLMKRNVHHVDLLAQVRLRSGGKALLLIHLEVQAGKINAAFSVRMLNYHVHLRQRYSDHAILSCAILLDRDHGADTEIFRDGIFGCELAFSFPVLNLASWGQRMAELESLAPLNPLAVVVLAQLECRATHADSRRMASKLRLIRALSKWGYSSEDRRILFIVLDALLALPDMLNDRFIESLEKTEDPAMMQQLNSYERVLLRREKAASLEEGLQKGRIEGELEGAAIVLKTQLQRKFGTLPDWAAIHIAEADTTTLQQWALNVLDARRIEDVFQQ